MNKITIKVGQQVDLDVNVAGEPPPAITWTLKDQLLQSNEQIRVDVSDYNTKFLIFRATRAYSGVYTINAKNSQGEDTAEVEILILGKLLFERCIIAYHQSTWSTRQTEQAQGSA